MINLDVLAIGNLHKDNYGKIIEAYSSSVLIRTDERMIVVDTSTRSMLPAIKASFKQIGVFPKDVDTVVLTHSHFDHIENNDMFENARILIHPDEQSEVAGSKPIEAGADLIPGVSIVHTPGHTSGSISVFVKADKNYAIAGDALPRYGNYVKMAPPAFHTDKEAALESIKLIIRYADVIIPGHDPPFLTNR